MQWRRPRFDSWVRKIHWRMDRLLTPVFLGFPGGSDGKKPPVMQETGVQPLDWADPLEKGTATHSIILAWRILWTEEPGRLQSIESQRVWHDWSTFTSLPFTDIFSTPADSRRWITLQGLYKLASGRISCIRLWNPKESMITLIGSSLKFWIRTLVLTLDSLLNSSFTT